MHLLRPHLKLHKWCIFEESDLQKSLKPLKTQGFRILADASKLTTLANKESRHPIGCLLSLLPRAMVARGTQRLPFLRSKAMVFNHRGNPPVFRQRRNHLPPYRTLKFAVGVAAAEKVAVFAKRNGRRCR